jgi:putative hydrolase of the HAD superfamily
MPRIRAVVFDMDDTLINWQQAEHAAIGDVAHVHLAPAGIVEEEARRVYADVMKDNLEGFKREKRWWYVVERLGILLDRLGISHQVKADAVATTFRQQVALRIATLPGAKEALLAVRASGRKVGLLTNGPSHIQRPKLYSLGLEPHFDFIGVSGELGHWKPDPEAFRMVLSRLGVPPEAALMVGDSLDFDLEPARSIGMQTCWMAPTGASSPLADAVIQEPGEVVPWFAPARGFAGGRPPAPVGGPSPS